MSVRDLHPIDKGALNALIDNEVRESKTIEYKQEMPGRAERDVGPFLASVCSLANSSGGDLILGMKATDGVPEEPTGMRIGNLDQEKLRLEHMLLNGVEPRLPGVAIREVEIAEETYVLIIRAPESWSAPHRVKRNSRFYARNSAGRYELDVAELRNAFAMSEAVSTRIRDFRADRLAKVAARETPVPLCEGGYMVVHIVPLNAFRARTEIPMRALQDHNNQVRPMDRDMGGFSTLINLDGLVTCAIRPPDESDTYAQMFRNGAVEGACTLDTNEHGNAALPSEWYEVQAANFVAEYLRIADNLEIEAPYYVFLSFVEVRGCEFRFNRGIWHGQSVPSWENDMMILPEAVIEDRSEQPLNALRPTFDMVWNAFGFGRSRNYDPEGNWVGQ